jgi:hypothetical protein
MNTGLGFGPLSAVWDQHDAELDFITDLERMLTIRCEL